MHFICSLFIHFSTNATFSENTALIVLIAIGRNIQIALHYNESNDISANTGAPTVCIIVDTTLAFSFQSIKDIGDKLMYKILKVGMSSWNIIQYITCLYVSYNSIGPQGEHSWSAAPWQWRIIGAGKPLPVCRAFVWRQSRLYRVDIVSHRHCFIPQLTHVASVLFAICSRMTCLVMLEMLAIACNRIFNILKLLIAISELYELSHDTSYVLM